MRRVIITLLLALLGLVPLAGAVMFLRTAAAPPQFFFEGPERLPRAPSPDELLALERSIRPGDRKLAAEVRNGAAALQQERAALSREGLPTSAAQLQAPPPPPQENAAADWTVIGALMKRKPLTKDEEKLISGLPRDGSHTDAQLQTLEQALASRRDLLAMVHRAARQQRCVFSRDWEKGTEVQFPEYATLRAACRLVKAESLLLAHKGHFAEAASTQADGFRIAAQGASDPCAISLLVGCSCNIITLSGYETMLYLGGDRSEVADEVYRALLRERPKFDVRRAMGGELGFFDAAFNRMREGGPAVMGDLADDTGKPAGALQRTLLRADQMTPEQLRAWRGYLYAEEARCLRAMRRVIGALDQPADRQSALLRTIEDELKRPPMDPTNLHAAIMVPVIAGAPEADARSRAQQEALLAGAQLLLYRSRKGAFPQRLDEALSPLPDPLTGKPLEYRREDNGFVVYSPGVDHRFEGGAPGTTIPRKEVGFRYPAGKPAE